MAAVLVFMLAAMVLAIAAVIITRLRASHRLTAKRFSLAASLGWGISLFVFYFLGLALASNIQPTSDLILLGLGIVVLNLVIAFPVSYLLYEFVISRLFPQVERSSE